MINDTLDTIRMAVSKMLVSLGGSGFEYPLHMLAKSSSGGAVGMSIERDGTLDLLLAEGKLDSFPLTFDVFDCLGKHHQLILVDGEEQAQQEMSRRSNNSMNAKEKA
jgi:hypothetical protein